MNAPSPQGQYTRRTHERPADRSKLQRIAMQDIQLYTCALRETVEPQNWSSADLPLATRRALQRLGLQGLTVLQAKFLRILPFWRRCIHRALEQSRNTLAVFGESQRKEAEKSLRRRFHWLFEKVVKGIHRILGKRKPQKAMEYVIQRCPCGLQWRRDDLNLTSTLLTWARQAAPWMDDSRYTIQADQSHVSVKVHALTDLYPLIQSSLRYPPFTDGGPPKLLYETGPWTGDNICTALECSFQSNAYHPQSTCDQCGHSGSIPLSIRADSIPTVQSRPAETSADSRRQAERENVSPDTPLEAELVEQPSTGFQTPVVINYPQGRYMVPGDGPGGRDIGSSHHDHQPIHRRIVHFCEGCLHDGRSECESDLRHNRQHIESMQFMESAGVFQGRTIPLGATISHPVSPLEFQRILARMPSRKACGVTAYQRRF